DQRSKPQPQAIRVGLGKGGAQDLIEDESGFEIGAGQGVLDPADALAQVEALRMLFRSGKQSLQPASKVGGLADIGLGASILAAQKKHSRGSGYGGEDFGVSLRAELEALGQHSPILIRMRCPLLETGLRDVGVGDPALTAEGTGSHRGTLERPGSAGRFIRSLRS